MDLIVEDEYIKLVGEYIEEQAEKISDYISDYISYMTSLYEEGFAEGKTSDALKQFVEEVDSSSKVDGSNYINLGKKAKRQCENFCTDIDSADQGLY